MRALGIDFGSKRIGLAVGVNEPFVVTTAQASLLPTGTLRRDAAAISDLMKKLETEVAVVGIPFNSDDTRMASVCQRLADEIRSLGVAVECIDESMTSVQAEDNLKQTDLTAAGRRKLRDGEAARLILERYFEQRPR